MPQNSKRTTSTGKHPTLRQDRHAVFKKAAREATKGTKHNAWNINLSKVKTCREANLNNGQGLKTVWTSDERQDPAKKYCSMSFVGDPRNLKIAIGLFAEPGKPFDELLFEEEITEGGYASIGVMSYELTQRLQITCHKTGAVPKDTVWEVSFLTDSAAEMALCKKGLRRLMRIVSQMPEECIFYKNFVDRQVREDSSLTLERDNGLTVTFGGFLGTAEGRRIVGKSLPEDPPAIVTRSGGASQKNTRAKKPASASDEGDSEPTRPLTRAQKRADMRAQKKQRKQKRREHASPQSADDEEADKASESPLIFEHGSSSPASSSADEAGQWDSEEEFEIESLGGVRVVNNETQYLVNWSDQGGRSWSPTWQPASNIAPESIEAYYRGLGTSAAAAPPRRDPVARGGRLQSERRRVVPRRGIVPSRGIRPSRGVVPTTRAKVVRRRGRSG